LVVPSRNFVSIAVQSPHLHAGRCFEIKDWNEQYPNEARLGTMVEIEHSQRICAEAVHFPQ
jgi:hypothetical protein